MDTTMYMSLEEYLRILESQGFQEVLKAPFVGREWKGLKWHPQNEVYFIYWRSPILVAFDSFGMEKVNGGYVWYNWKPHKQREEKFFLESTSYWIDDILVGKHDCRVDFVRTLDILDKNGTFISPWKEHQLWLVNYVERYEGKEEIVTRDRLAMLPQEIKECVGNGVYRVVKDGGESSGGGAEVPAGPPNAKNPS